MAEELPAPGTAAYEVWQRQELRAQREARQAHVAEYERRGTVAAKAVRGLKFSEARPLLDKWLLEPSSRELAAAAWDKMIAAWLVEHRPALPGLGELPKEVKA
jgi:hypothetical protein